MMAGVSGRTAAVFGAVLFIICLVAALSVDVVKTGFGLKGDEATYVSIGLSAAFDRDLTYERRDLERFFGLYRSGPDGIFLKRGKRPHLSADATPPFLHVTTTPDRRSDRLYFGKALLYGVLAAPFVRVLGLNGFFVFHVVLLFAAAACLYAFLAARSRPGAALAFTTAFIGASCVPVYMVFIAPEILHFSLVAFAYFLWLYKEVAPASERSSRLAGFLRGPSSDILAAVLLGAVIYSKPPHILLIVPPVLWLWTKRFYRHGLVTGVICAATTALLFAGTALNTGEFNYQGGDRKACYTGFPFDGATPDPWNVNRNCPGMATNDSDAENVLKDFTHRFTTNVKYFLIGRHFGFVPYFFPGVVAVMLWLLTGERLRPIWRPLTFAAVAASAVILLVIAPFTWSGGGGPPGNRYFMSLYAPLFFLTPPLMSTFPGVLAWAGGALFTAKMLLNPFVAAKFPSQTTERGFARQLPVELTMANDLPVELLGEPRAHTWMSDVLLYFLDEHSYPPEVVDAEGHRGIWIAGDGRAEILIRCEWEIDRLEMQVRSRVPTTFIVSMGGAAQSVRLEPDKPATVTVPAAGIRDLRSYAYLLKARSTEGFVPHLLDPTTDDMRNLGVLVQFTAIPKAK